MINKYALFFMTILPWVSSSVCVILAVERLSHRLMFWLHSTSLVFLSPLFSGHLIKFLFTLRGTNLWKWLYYLFNMAFIYGDCRTQSYSRWLSNKSKSTIYCSIAYILWIPNFLGSSWIYSLVDWFLPTDYLHRSFYSLNFCINRGRGLEI